MKNLDKLDKFYRRGTKAPPAERAAWNKEDNRRRLVFALQNPEQALDTETGVALTPYEFDERRVEEAPREPGWLANPNLEGYGRQWQWPFNHLFAVRSKSYRQGVINAINNPRYASNWRFEAKRYMTEILELLAQQEATYWDIVREELENETF